MPGPAAAAALTINGTFTASGGMIVDNVNTQNGTSGLITVNGDVNFSDAATFSTVDQATTPRAVPGQSWPLMTWTGSLTGFITLAIPQDWSWETVNGLTLIEPNQ